MLDPFLDHPPEDALERYLLNHCKQEELQHVETHILGCESCLARLEALELNIAATKEALQQLENEQRVKETAKVRAPWRNWFTVPSLSWAAGVACLAAMLIVAPRFVPSNVDLSSYRGAEAAVMAPEGRPLHMHLNTTDLVQGPVSVQVVDGNGYEIWKGTTTIQSNGAEVTLPKITDRGTHYLRLYAPGDTTSDLLREFAFDVE